MDCAEALQYCRPWKADAEADAEVAQQEAHRAALKGAPSEPQGYVSWLSEGALATGASCLLIRETLRHIGTRIWESAWLHRAWALREPQLFPRGVRVHEMGAGCGLLGLTVAAHFGVDVTRALQHETRTQPSGLNGLADHGAHCSCAQSLTFAAYWMGATTSR